MADAEPLADRAARARRRRPGSRRGRCASAGAHGPADRPSRRRRPARRRPARCRSGRRRRASRRAQQHRFQVVLAAQAPAGGAEPGQRAARVDLPGRAIPGRRRSAVSACRMPWFSASTDAALRMCGSTPGGPETAPWCARCCRGRAGWCEVAGVLLDQQVLDAEAAQEQRGGQAHQGAADDQDGHSFALGWVTVRLIPVRCVGFPVTNSSRAWRARISPGWLRIVRGRSDTSETIWWSGNQSVESETAPWPSQPPSSMSSTDTPSRPTPAAGRPPAGRPRRRAAALP